MKLDKPLVRMQRDFERLTRPYWVADPIIKEELSLEEKRQVFVKNTEEFLEYVVENRIFFSDSLCVKLDDLYDEFRHTFSELSSSATDASQSRKKWNDAWLKAIGEFPGIEEDIVSEFRQMLGVTDCKSHTAGGNAESIPEEEGLLEE